MIFVFSRHYEPTTDNVISYLLRDKVEFVRFNEEEGIGNIHASLCSDTGNISLNKQKLKPTDVFFIYQYNLISTWKSPIENRETLILRDYLLSKVSGNQNALGSSLADIYHNKLLDLELAKQCGMDIPLSYIITSLDQCRSLNLRNNSWIVKPMSNYFTISNKNTISIIDMYKVHWEDIAHLCEGFFPTLFQQIIDKTFEVRVVVLKTKIFAVAYFTSNQDSISFKYSKDNEMFRIVPFELPDYLISQITNYMKARNLNFSSLDFIYSGNTDKFYFIECNPVGQIDWVSKAGNYYLEKEIAKILLHEK